MVQSLDLFLMASLIQDVSKVSVLKVVYRQLTSFAFH